MRFNRWRGSILSIEGWATTAVQNDIVYNRTGQIPCKSGDRTKFTTLGRILSLTWKKRQCTHQTWQNPIRWEVVRHSRSVKHQKGMWRIHWRNEDLIFWNACYIQQTLICETKIRMWGLTLFSVSNSALKLYILNTHILDISQAFTWPKFCRWSFATDVNRTKARCKETH